MDKSYKTWVNKLKEDNLKDGTLVFEQLENALFDNDDHGEMSPPSTTMVTLTKTPTSRASFQFHFHLHSYLHLQLQLLL